MDIWVNGRKTVEKTFFKDSIELYANGIVENALGEEIEKQVLVGIYNCNIENGQSDVKIAESGTSIPQSIRISIPKGTPLDYNFTYKVKIQKARLIFDSTEWWKVEGWTEAQLSTVITATREVSV